MSEGTGKALWTMVFVAACAGPASPRPLAPAAPSDDAVELAAMLPEEIDRCVVVRPRRLSARRRSFAVLSSWAEPLAYAEDVAPSAYASATAERMDGTIARRTYVRFTASGDDAERRARGLPVRWLDEPCEGLGCQRPVARWVDERTVEIARHPWPRRPLPVSSAGCVQLARRARDAYEVAVDGAHARLGRRAVPRPRTVLRVSRSDGGAIRTWRELTFRDALEARLWEGFTRRQGASPDVALVPSPPHELDVERDGARVVVTEARLWEELELALEDERLRRRGLALARQRAEPVPVEEVDVSRMAVVRHQLRLRRTQIDHARGRGRRAETEALARLLERAYDAHPSELELAALWVQAELSLDRPERARAVAERVIASDLAPREERWRRLRREALARIDAAGLAAALVEDGVTDRADAARAAEDLIALGRAGVPWEWAEGAWLESRRLLDGRPVRGSSVRSRADARLPWASALPVVAALARLDGAPRGATVHAAVHAERGTEVGAAGALRPELVSVRAPGGGVAVVGAWPGLDLVALRRAAEPLSSLAPDGPITVVVELRLPEGDVVRRVRARGVREGDELVLSGLDGLRRPPAWPMVERYLARPLAELSTSLFPPPTLVVRAESPEVAQALRRAALPMSSGECAAAGPVLRCSAPGQPEQLGELLLRLAASRMTP